MVWNSTQWKTELSTPLLMRRDSVSTWSMTRFWCDSNLFIKLTARPASSILALLRCKVWWPSRKSTGAAGDVGCPPERSATMHKRY